MARRHPPSIVRFGNLGFTPTQQAKLEELSRAVYDGFDGDVKPHAGTHLQTGLDPLRRGAAPPSVRVGGTASAGTGPEYMLSNAQLIVPAGVPVAIGTANAEGVAETGVRSDHVHQRNVEVQSGGVLVGIERLINFASGATVTDNPGSNRVDVSIPAGPGAILTEYGVIAWDGAAIVQRGLPAALDGNIVWVDVRDATHIGAGDAPNMPGHPWLGHWIRDAGLTNAVAFEVFRVAMPNDVDEWSGHVEYTAVGSDGTLLNKEVAEIKVSAIRDALSVVDAVTGAPFGILQHLPVGTIAVTWTASVVGTDAIFSCTIDSSIAADVWLEFKIRADNNAQTMTLVQT